jgi:hypothetical protein
MGKDTLGRDDVHARHHATRGARPGRRRRPGAKPTKLQRISCSHADLELLVRELVDQELRRLASELVAAEPRHPQERHRQHRRRGAIRRRYGGRPAGGEDLPPLRRGQTAPVVPTGRAHPGRSAQHLPGLQEAAPARAPLRQAAGRGARPGRHPAGTRTTSSRSPRPTTGNAAANCSTTCGRTASKRSSATGRFSGCCASPPFQPDRKPAVAKTELRVPRTHPIA